jgi:hypothetical protein
LEKYFAYTVDIDLLYYGFYKILKKYFAYTVDIDLLYYAS